MVQVFSVDSAIPQPTPADGARVHLEGSEQDVGTDASGVATVFGTFDADKMLTVMVPGTTQCKLLIKAGPAAPKKLTVHVPRTGKGECKFGG